MSAGSQNGRVNGGNGHGHLNEEWIRKYQSKGLAMEELQAGGRHLSGCGVCRRALLARIGPARLPEELAEIPDALHLSYEQITDYIDGRLSLPDKERVEAHTFICDRCSREMDGLRKLDAQLAGPAVEVKPEPAKLSGWARIAEAFRASGAAPKFGLAFGVILAGIFLLSPGSRTAAPPSPDVNQFVLSFREGLHLGGYALVIGGMLYIVYLLGRRR